MTRVEVIAKLRKEGFSASAGRIRQAMMHGYIEPMPSKGPRGAYDFQPQHLRQLRRYFVRVRPGPTPVHAEELPIRGSADRVHRLAREKQRLRGRGPSERVLRRQRRREADAAIRFLEGIARQLAR